MKKEIIRIHNLSLTINKQKVLNEITFDFSNNNFYTILGGNGTGKTTLLKSIIGFIDFDEGEVKVDKTIKISFVPDSSYLYEYLTGLEYLVFIGKLNDMEEGEILRKSDSILKDLYLYESRNKIINHYSNGMKQKLSIASSILIEPDILLIDEPMTGTDILSNKVIMNFLKQYSADNLVIMTTHFLEIAYELSDYVLILKEGTITEVVQPSLLSQPQFIQSVEDFLYGE